MSGRSQTILAGVCAGVVMLAFFFLFIKPRRAELGRVRADVAAERNRTQQLQTEVARLEALRDDAPRLQAALDEMRALVPKTNEVPSFIFAVQEAADQAGVGFLQITPELPKPPPEGAELAEVRATIGAEGGYFAVQDFIRRLYDLDRAVRIDGVTMTGIEDEESADDASVSVQLVARIFFDLPEGASAATTGTTTTTTTPPTTTP